MRLRARLRCWRAGRLLIGRTGLPRGRERDLNHGGLGVPRGEPTRPHSCTSGGGENSNHRGNRVHRGNHLLPYSFFTTSPPFITNFTRSRILTSFTGSPSTDDVGQCSR